MKALKAQTLRTRNDARAVFDDMYSRGFTDGLPVLPPTQSAVWEMIDHVGLPPDDTVATLMPNDEPVTVEQVAINAVMAGCLPEYLPVVIAAVKAVSNPDFNLLGIQTTTNPVSPVLLVNGPIRGEIDINCGRNCLGPGWRANATIGRALRLILLNCAGGSPGDVDKATHGMPGKFTCCFGELQEQSPWDPYHVEHGFSADQSAVTAFGGQGTTNVIAIYQKPETIVHVVAESMRCAGYNAYRNAWGSPLLLLTPGHAKIFSEHGWDKSRVKQELFERCKIPRSRMPEERLLVGAIYDNYAPDEMCLVCRKAEDIAIVVAGGPEAYHITYIPSFGHTDPVTVGIDLPARSIE